MSPLVKKEIRLLLPAWIAAILLASIPTWIAPVWSRVPPEVDLYVQLAFALGFLLLGIASFGQEFGSGTFAMLLSQPVQRRRLWFVKTVVLAGAFVSVLLALLVSWTVHFNLYDFALYNQHRPTAGLAPDMSRSLLGGLALFAVVCFSGGLWTTLLLRRISEAFWITLLTPLAIMVTLYAFHEYFHWSNQTDNFVIPTILLLYSLAGFLWARRLFLRAQDLQWTGGVLAFSSRKRTLGSAIVSSYPRHWFSALVRKELQLQQVNILIAGVVLALHLTSVVLRMVHPNFYNPNVKGLLELIWMLWLAVPLLIGSAAVAEERRVGVTESQFCLPVSRRVQFAVKFFTTLILSLVLGGLMPFIVERGHDLNYYIFVVAAVIFFISFYASTLVRTTLQAIGLALVLSAVLYLYLAGEAIAIARLAHGFTHAQQGLILLKFRLGIPISLLVLACLAFGNFKWLRLDGKLWRRNLIAVLAAFAAVSFLSHAIYFRAWEWLIPIEPPHGPARLSDATQVKFAATQNTLFATSPDGRLWIETPAFDQASQLAPKQSKSESVGGSNWVAVTADNFQILGIQSNGSLWSLQRQWNPSQGLWWQTGPFKLTQIGLETNWSRAAGGRLGFLLLKNDGSLWIWGTNGYTWRDSSNSIPRKLKLDLAAPPARVGEESNWTEVFTSRFLNQGATGARNNSGTILELTAEEKTNFEYVRLQSTNASGGWISVVSGGWSEVGLKMNEDIWFSWQDWTNNEYIPGGKIQLGKKAKWKSVGFLFESRESVIAIRSDGTLWEWPEISKMDYNSIPIKPVRNPDSVNPVQLGNHADWITLFTYWSRTFALAADGSLWVWDEPSGHVWLAPSRKPVFIGNIFTAP